MENKICVKCNKEKNIEQFRKYSDNKYSSTCKSCLNELDKLRKKNLRKINSETLIYKCEICNTEKALFQFSKLKKNYKQKVCSECYPSYLKNQKNQWCFNESKSNINYRIKKSLASRLRTVIHKNDSTMNYIGCNIQYLREWFEYNFTSDMNWDNYGLYWHIDHIIPVNCFNLEDEKQKLICWNWSNLVPLEKTKNCSKKCLIDTLQINKVRENLIKFKEEGSTTKWFSDNYMILLQTNEYIENTYGNVKNI